MSRIVDTLLKSPIIRSDSDALLVILTEIIRQINPHELSFETTLGLEKVITNHMNKMDPLNTFRTTRIDNPKDTRTLTEQSSLATLIEELKTSNDTRDTAIAITGFLKSSDPSFLPRSVVVDLKEVLEDHLRTWSQDL